MVHPSVLRQRSRSFRRPGWPKFGQIQSTAEPCRAQCVATFGRNCPTFWPNSVQPRRLNLVDAGEFSPNSAQQPHTSVQSWPIPDSAGVTNFPEFDQSSPNFDWSLEHIGPQSENRCTTLDWPTSRSRSVKPMIMRPPFRLRAQFAAPPGRLQLETPQSRARERTQLVLNEGSGAIWGSQPDLGGRWGAARSPERGSFEHFSDMGRDPETPISPNMRVRHVASSKSRQVWSNTRPELDKIVAKWVELSRHWSTSPPQIRKTWPRSPENERKRSDVRQTLPRQNWSDPPNIGRVRSKF